MFATVKCNPPGKARGRARARGDEDRRGETPAGKIAAARGADSGRIRGSGNRPLAGPAADASHSGRSRRHPNAPRARARARARVWVWVRVRFGFGGVAGLPLAERLSASPRSRFGFASPPPSPPPRLRSPSCRLRYPSRRRRLARRRARAESPHAFPRQTLAGPRVAAGLPRTRNHPRRRRASSVSRGAPGAFVRRERMPPRRTPPTGARDRTSAVSGGRGAGARGFRGGTADTVDSVRALREEDQNEGWSSSGT